MVKADGNRIKGWRKNSRTSLASSPTAQRFLRPEKPPEEVKSEENLTTTVNSHGGEIPSETDALNENEKDALNENKKDALNENKKDALSENEKICKESESRFGSTYEEFKNFMKLITSRIVSHCRGKELFIFGLVVIACLVCIQTILYKKSLHETKTEHMEILINKLITENDRFKSEVLNKIRSIEEGVKILNLKSSTSHKKLLEDLRIVLRDMKIGTIQKPAEATSLQKGNGGEFAENDMEIDADHNSKTEEDSKRKNAVLMFLVILSSFLMTLLLHRRYEARTYSHILEHFKRSTGGSRSLLSKLGY